jgi:hypothetical protein
MRVVQAAGAASAPPSSRPSRPWPARVHAFLAYFPVHGNARPAFAAPAEHRHRQHFELLAHQAHGLGMDGGRRVAGARAPAEAASEAGAPASCKEKSWGLGAAWSGRPVGP